MNEDTHRIAKLLKIDLETAVKVQNQMAQNGVDFSECTKKAFNQEARLAYEEIS